MFAYIDNWKSNSHRSIKVFTTGQCVNHIWSTLGCMRSATPPKCYAPMTMLPSVHKRKEKDPPPPQKKQTHNTPYSQPSMNERHQATVKSQHDSPLTHLQWRLHAPGSGSAGPGHQYARSGRRLRKCSGGQTRTDGSLPWWLLSWTKQTASPLGRFGQPGPKQFPNRTGQPLSLQTIRIRIGTGWTGEPERERGPGPCLEWAWLAETAERYRTQGRSTGNSSWFF